jgi:hypothetical protein
MFIQILDCSVEERLRDLQALLFLSNTFRVDDLIEVTKSKPICTAPSDWNFEIAGAEILDLLLRNWDAAFGVLSNPVKNLLFRIEIQSTVLSSISWRMQAILDCEFQGTSWTIECPHQSIDRNWNIVLQFGDITNNGHLVHQK